MRKSNHHAIRALLRKHHDGLRTPDIARAIGVDASSVLKALRSMPDAYIDRWQMRNPDVYGDVPRGRTAAVWCVVVPPDDCPRPESGRKEKQ